MNFIDIIFSTSKLAISSFITALFVVLYEAYLYIGETRKIKKPKIPEFKPGDNLPKVASPLPARLTKKPFNRQVFVIVSAIFIFGLVSLILEFLPSRPVSNHAADSIPSTTSQIRIITSSGIEIYDKTWHHLSVDKLKLQKNEEIIIAIKTISAASIDKARIRVNSVNWMPTDETNLFNDSLGLFYRIYKVGTVEAILNIEAELHTEADGWLE